MSTQLNKVTSSLKRLLWYHWALAILQSIAALSFIGLFIFGLLYDFDRDKMLQILLGVALTGGVWYASAFAMFRKQVVLSYDDRSVFEMKDVGIKIRERIGFENISRTVRRSANCLELHFVAPVMADTGILFWITILQENFRTFGNMRVNSFTIKGNEPELDRLSETLRKANVSVEADSIPNDDPTKMNAILILSLLALVLMFAGIVYLVVPH
jgi:hypothetical protein